ncbi:hypothetical protein BPSOL_0887 [Bifidobacterium pseudolongum]|nr:hypothetical protein BPSOL_0887 [Bifidobacterium pseudolongum]
MANDVGCALACVVPPVKRRNHNVFRSGSMLVHVYNCIPCAVTES